MSIPQTRPLVLIVDDDSVIRLTGAIALEGGGFRVAQAADGSAGREMVERCDPDLILLDVDMPRENGFSLCKGLRESPRWRLTPVLMMTGLDETLSIDAAFAAGATDFVPKPVNWALLIHRLHYMLRSAAALRALEQTAADLAASQWNLARAQRIAKLGTWEWLPPQPQMTWSDESFRILGLAGTDELPTLQLLQRLVPDREQTAFRRWCDTALLAEQTQRVQRFRRPDGQERVVHIHAERLTSSGGDATRVTGTFQDVTDRWLAEEEIRRLAQYDSLTNLPNRGLFREQLSHALSRSRRRGDHVAVLSVDLDQFQQINESLGHGVGDELLHAVATRLVTALRAGDVAGRMVDKTSEAAARLGGDEFAVLLEGLTADDQAATAAERMQQELTHPFKLARHEVYVSPSVGIAVSPRDGEDGETLLDHANAALAQVKRAGGNDFQFYDQRMNQAARDRLRLQAALRQALAHDEFSLVYQPQMDLLTGQLAGAEALLRWRNDAFGSVSPAEFVPLAERAGLIGNIGTWVLTTACQQAQRWRDARVVMPRIAVNISMLQFANRGFVSSVTDVLQRTGLPPEVLELEITESVLAQDADAALQTLHALKAFGIHISIDDFGTGYSSLSYLKRFPVDRLKIDRSFVSEVDRDPDDAAIASAIIAMSRTMRLKVVAEGVETESQLSVLRRSGCDEIQGYWFCRPLAPEALSAWLAERRASLPALEASSNAVLVVDDDPSLLEMLATVLENAGFPVLTATSCAAAFALAARHEIGVVICDYRMPDMNGAEFFARVSRLYPQTVRIMLTGHRDVDDVISAVNRGDLYRYLEKPVPTAMLVETLREALTLHTDLAAGRAAR